MEDSRLLKLLRTFSSEELNALKKFIASPFFNQRKEVVDLFTLLEKPLKRGRPAPDKETAFRAIFKGNAFDDHRIRMTLSFLYQLSCQFVAVQDCLNDPAKFKMRMASDFRRRNLPDHFALVYEEAEKAQQEQHLRNADFFEARYQLLLEKHRFNVDSQSGTPQHLQHLSDHFDQTVIARKLWQACFMLSHQALHNVQYDYGLLQAMLEHVEQNPELLEIPAISIYYYGYRAMTEGSDRNHFATFKNLIYEHSALFPVEELRDLHIMAINFCIRQYNTGNLDYLPIQFAFYKDGFAKKYFLNNDTLSRYTYLNAATIGLVMHEPEWVEHFLHEYKIYLQEPYQESLFSFNLARLEHYRKRLNEALLLLQKAEYKDLILNLAAKTLQIKIFYQLGEFDLLESHLQAINAFIRRKKIMGYHRENYLNTVYFTQKLLKLNPIDKAARKQLHAEIEQCKAVVEKGWLLEVTA